jgi:hypothetical protein
MALKTVIFQPVAGAFFPPSRFIRWKFRPKSGVNESSLTPG